MAIAKPRVLAGMVLCLFVGLLISTSFYINEMMNHAIPVPFDFKAGLVLDM